MVKLNAKTIFQGKDGNRMKEWEMTLGKVINTISRRSESEEDKYIFVTAKGMVGCFIGLFVKCKVLSRIRYIKSTKIKTGFGGNAGNKGAVAIRFFVDDTSMMFVNCHLLSGRRKGLKRVEEMKKILETAFANETSREMCAEKYDNVFIFGDLNFRVNLDND